MSAHEIHPSSIRVALLAGGRSAEAIVDLATDGCAAHRPGAEGSKP